MTIDEREYAIRLIDLALVQLEDEHPLDARNTLRSLRRVMTGPPELLKKKDPPSETG